MTYVFYGLEIPKSWEHWPSAFGDTPLNIQIGDGSQKIEVSVPNIGGEPVLIRDKAVIVDGFELTLYRYPHDVENDPHQEYLGVLGYLICEIIPYTDPTNAFQQYTDWHKKFSTISNFDVILEKVCTALEFNFIGQKILTCTTNCSCCY